MAKSDRILADAEALLQRVSPEGRRLAQRARSRRRQATLRTARRLGWALLVVVAASLLWGLVIGPIGQIGFFGALLAVAAAWAVILLVSRMPEETPERLVQSDLPRLPARTDAWLQSQRPALPGGAARLVDGIGTRLEALGPQLAGVDPNTPVAEELRKLIAEELPELVQGYQRVPSALRRRERDGTSPDRQLIDGLTVVDEELGRLCEQLAHGDMHRLATQGRYLEIKYRDGGDTPA